jgi:hypothetical protein
VVLACPPAAAGALLADEVEAWGGEWRALGTDGGTIVLPVAAGLRHGVVEGKVMISADGAGSRVTLEVTAATYRVNTVAAAILAFGAAGALLLLVWALYPQLLELAPLGALAALAAWLLVAARLRSSGPQDYLDALAATDAGRTSEG